MGAGRREYTSRERGWAEGKESARISRGERSQTRYVESRRSWEAQIVSADGSCGQHARARGVKEEGGGELWRVRECRRERGKAYGPQGPC